jgi:hypothetical protein
VLLVPSPIPPKSQQQSWQGLPFFGSPYFLGAFRCGLNAGAALKRELVS